MNENDVFGSYIDDFLKELDNVSSLTNLSTDKTNDELYTLIQNKSYEEVNKLLYKDNLWNDKCKKLLIDNIEEYLSLGYGLPIFLYNSDKVLNKLLKNGNIDQINLFIEEAWTEENIKILFDKYNDIKNIPYNLQSSIKALSVALNNNYIDKLGLFNKTAVTEEIENIFIQKCIEGKITTIPNTFKTENILTKLINNNLLSYATQYEFNSWKEEHIKLFIEKLDNYQGSLSYDRFYTLDNSDILYALIKNKRYEAVSKIYYKEKIWDKKCKEILIDNIEEYLSLGYRLPRLLYGSDKVLNKFLKNGNIDQINLFKEEAWTEENIYILVNLLYSDNIKPLNINLNVSNSNTIKSMLYNYNKLVDSDIKKEFDILINKDTNEESNNSNEYKAYIEFLKNTNSIEIYLFILRLTNNDIDKIKNYFTENGPTKPLLNELIFLKEYRVYCKNNNIDILENVNDTITLNYIKIAELFPDLNKYIYTDKKNINEYFDESGPKIELYYFLLNIRAINLLYELNNKFPKLDLKYKLVLEKTINIDEVKMQEIFLNYCKIHINTLDENKIEETYILLRKIENSNSGEIRHFQETLTKSLLELDNPAEKLDEIEKIFLKNNLPHFAKVFLTFKIMHPNYNEYSFNKNSTISPTLKNCNDLSKDVTIFTRLLMAQLGSNNHLILEYVNTLLLGNELFNKYKDNDINELTNEEKELLKIFGEHIETLYNNSLLGKKNGQIIIKNFNSLERVVDILKPNKDDPFDLTNRIISMFCGNAGFKTVESLINYSNNYLKEREQYHRDLEQANDFSLKDGYYIKGIGNKKYLSNLAQYGICCVELLGDSSGSDLTPFDTDVSRIIGNYSTNQEAINDTPSSSYGKTFLVFKEDSRFSVTRGSDNVEKPLTRKTNLIEIFKTLKDNHYGILAAIAFSDVEYIMTDEYDKTFGMVLATNGIYIPVVDMDGKLLFTYDDYMKIRNKMEGLSYYGFTGYNLSDDVVRDDLDSIVNNLTGSINDASYKRQCILDTIQKRISLTIKTQMDGDIKPGSIEIIDTGSTGRGTNVPNDSDFDFIVRIDRDILIHEKKLKELKESIAKALGKEYTGGDFRFEGVSIPGVDIPLDIDMTFIAKSNKMDYATEDCIKDRLNTIKKLYPDKYEYVLANIIIAKQLFKEYKCYKPRHAGKGKAQGGLGGVGVENWILQNGGSLLQAAKNFLECAKDKDFDSFVKSYPINDFGSNHLAEKKGQFPYDNYVFNLDEKGYNKIKAALNDYVLGKVNLNEQTENMKNR